MSHSFGDCLGAELGLVNVCGSSEWVSGVLLGKAANTQSLNCREGLKALWDAVSLSGCHSWWELLALAPAPASVAGDTS